MHADDPIAQWLKQDGSDGQNDQIRPDLHALTNQQLQDIFKIGRDQADGHQLIEGGSEERPRVLYIWVAAIAAGFGMAIGAIRVSHYLSCRRLCRMGNSHSNSRITWFSSAQRAGRDADGAHPISEDPPIRNSTPGRPLCETVHAAGPNDGPNFQYRSTRWPCMASRPVA